MADLDEQGRAAAVAELGLPAFRAKQLAHQYYGRLIADPRQMTDLPVGVRDLIAEAMFPTLLTAATEVSCDAGQTRKTLWRAVDGATFESVLMRYPQRNTLCISSQAGCGMNCPFCATGQAGLDSQPVDGARSVEQVRRRRSSRWREVRFRVVQAAFPTWSSWAWASRWRFIQRGARQLSDV